MGGPISFLIGLGLLGGAGLSKAFEPRTVPIPAGSSGKAFGYDQVGHMIFEEIKRDVRLHLDGYGGFDTERLLKRFDRDHVIGMLTEWTIRECGYSEKYYSYDYEVVNYLDSGEYLHPMYGAAVEVLRQIENGASDRALQEIEDVMMRRGYQDFQFTYEDVKMKELLWTKAVVYRLIPEPLVPADPAIDKIDECLNFIDAKTMPESADATKLRHVIDGLLVPQRVKRRFIRTYHFEDRPSKNRPNLDVREKYLSSGSQMVNDLFSFHMNEWDIYGTYIFDGKEMNYWVDTLKGAIIPISEYDIQNWNTSEKWSSLRYRTKEMRNGYDHPILYKLIKPRKELQEFWKDNRYIQYKRQELEEALEFADKYDLSFFQLDGYDVAQFCSDHIGPQFTKILTDSHSATHGSRTNCRRGDVKREIAERKKNEEIKKIKEEADWNRSHYGAREAKKFLESDIKWAESRKYYPTEEEIDAEIDRRKQNKEEFPKIYQSMMEDFEHYALKGSPCQHIGLKSRSVSDFKTNIKQLQEFREWQQLKREDALEHDPKLRQDYWYCKTYQSLDIYYQNDFIIDRPPEWEKANELFKTWFKRDDGDALIEQNKENYESQFDLKEK